MNCESEAQEESGAEEESEEPTLPTNQPSDPPRVVSPIRAHQTLARSGPAIVSPVNAGDDGSNTTTPDDIGEVGSFLLTSLNLELNDFDVSLAALSRPDGSEYGPDEHSI